MWRFPLLLVVLCCGLLTTAKSSAQERVTVVIVQTEGPYAWAAAERRFLAELKTLPIRIILLPGRRDVDRRLSDHARRYQATAVIQSLRFGDRGVVRAWLSRVGDAPGGYRNISVEVRDRDVLQSAVRPMFELVFARVMMAEARSPDTSQPTSVPVPKAQGTLLDNPIQADPQLSRASGVLLSSGPWFSGRRSTPAMVGLVRVRRLFWSHLSLEPELFFQWVPHVLGPAGQQSETRLMGGRAHAMLVPWPRAQITLALGAGLAFVGARHTNLASDAQYSTAVGASFRALIRAPLGEHLALALGLTSTWMSLAATTRAGELGLDVPAVDGGLGFEWQWGEVLGGNIHSGNVPEGSGSRNGVRKDEVRQNEVRQ